MVDETGKKCWRKWAAIVLEKRDEKIKKACENMVEKTGKVSNCLHSKKC